ncbi:hypothetical protein FW774_13240 [Pedobacter sp. BS3]|uniref:hypothetical protein n=1 Tax=Pedobacter sp. BS3 TaxID=2567937 RepID=UPI0011EF3E11|nr:hypothetical protein [Pedobacter sp. BS3]TZF83247.1 hypothetical protein FW774_13240 [Pedobacter sp. BS3]
MSEKKELYLRISKEQSSLVNDSYKSVSDSSKNKNPFLKALSEYKLKKSGNTGVKKTQSINPFDNLPVKKYTINDFALKIKAKYPQYQHVDNNELVMRIIKKYPEYKDSVQNQESLIISQPIKSVKKTNTNNSLLLNSFFVLVLLLSLLFIIRNIKNIGLKRLKINKNYYKALLATVIGSLLILIATNPSRSDFTSYLHSNSNRNIGRDKNYLICSIYSWGSYDNNAKKKYLGILGNFYPLNTKKK